jgi:Glycosyltransferases involved in cell wall biogenesis
MSSPQLSVIIVSYNVKYFLRQCLQSVERALEGLTGEVWVVDNASVDGSVEMVKQEFPGVAAHRQ